MQIMYLHRNVCSIWISNINISEGNKSVYLFSPTQGHFAILEYTVIIKLYSRNVFFSAFPGICCFPSLINHQFHTLGKLSSESLEWHSSTAEWLLTQTKNEQINQASIELLYQTFYNSEMIHLWFETVKICQTHKRMRRADCISPQKWKRQMDNNLQLTFSKTKCASCCFREKGKE